LILEQLQNAHNYLQYVLREVFVLREMLANYVATIAPPWSDASDAEQGQLPPADDKVVLSQQWEGSLQWIRRAQDQLTTSLPEFPDNVFARSVFSPSLPPEIVIEFQVVNHNLVLNVYVLSIGNLKNNPSGKTKQNLSAKEKAELRKGVIAGTSFPWQGKRVEVAQHFTVTCSVPLFVAIVGTLDTAYNLCSDLMDKFTIIST